MLEDVGLDPDIAADRRPHQFSGGQCQRICIARALVLDPKLIICDEPVSALDVSVQAQVLNLLEDLKHRYGLTLMFIAHDLAVVKNVSDRVGVMYLGKMCEVAGADDALRAAGRTRTRDACSSRSRSPTPRCGPDPNSRIEGEIPSPVFPPSGCRFRTRCPRAQDRCAVEEPHRAGHRPDHYVACHFPLIGETAPAGGEQRGGERIRGVAPAPRATGMTDDGQPDRPRTRLAREERRDLLVDAAAAVLRRARPGRGHLRGDRRRRRASRVRCVYNYFGDRQGLIEAVRPAGQRPVVASG